MNRTRGIFRAGGLLPALLVLPVAMAAASIPPKPLPKPGEQPQVRHEAASPLDAAVDRAAARLRSGKETAAAPDAVDFALYLYAESGRKADLELAATLAEHTPEVAGPAPLYRVAQAGGATLAAANSRLQGTPSAIQNPGIETGPAAVWAEGLLARAAVAGDPSAIQDALMGSAAVLDSRLRHQGNRLSAITADAQPADFETTLRMLRVLVATAELSGSPQIRGDAGKLALELVRRFWDEGSASFGSGPDAPALALQAGAARTLWEAGFLTADRLLTGRAGRVLDGIRERALRDPQALPAFGLAAARVSRHPVQMVLLGTAGDPTLADLRQRSYALFEPRRILLSLDPQADADRIQELGYPAELAPVLFVCVESICSPPIQSPDGLGKKVKDIVALAGGVEQ